MPFLFTDQSRAGVPIAYNFTYGGNAVNWGTTKITNMSGVSVKAEPFDGDLAVSGLSVSFSDTDGSIWGSLGHGTLALGSTWEATCYVGGTMGEQAYGPNATRLARLNTGNAATYVIHKGRITGISRNKRIVTIQSESAMKQLAVMEWRFPVYPDQYSNPTILGTDFFFSGSPPAVLDSALFNYKKNKTEFDAYVFIGPEHDVEIDYPTPSGRGTIGKLPTFHFPGTQFYLDYDRFFFEGSYLGTFLGTLDTEDKAHNHGYVSVAVAEAAKVPTGPTGTTYNIDRTRYTFVGDQPSFSKGAFWTFQQGQFEMEDTPAVLWRELLTGMCSEPLFGSATDIEPLSYATAVANTAFQTFSYRIPPVGGKVLPSIKDLLQTLSGLMSVDSSNRFRINSYGPKNLSDVLGTISGSEVIDSNISLSEDDKFNHVMLEYGYGWEAGSYSKRAEVKGTGWSYTNDFPLKIQSKWVNNENLAQITAQRLVNRFQKGISRLNLTMPLTRLAIDVGSLYTIEDTDTGLISRIFEVVGWSKDYCNSRKVNAQLLDGDALYRSRGYARWEGDNDMTKVVSGTSTSGWAAGATVNNINGDFYGNSFKWF